VAETVYHLLGLARRAGKVESGDAAARSAIARKKAFLLLLADDSAQRTKKAFEELSASAGIPLYSFGSKIELGRSMGRPHRSVVAITERNLARAVVRALEGGGM
jgi:ribosomal protein L7Ae-like RNA K-turn-binding protein